MYNTHNATITGTDKLLIENKYSQRLELNSVVKPRDYMWCLCCSCVDPQFQQHYVTVRSS